MNYSTLPITQQFEKLRKYGEEQVSYLMAYSYQKLGVVLANPYGQALSKIVNSAVDLTNKMVDYYLPPSEDEIKESGSQEESNNGNSDESVDPNTLGGVAKKVGALSYKMRRRVMSQNLSKIVNSAIDLTNKTVDYYLPPLEDEVQAGQQQQPNGDSGDNAAVDLNVIQNVVKQVGTLSTKMRRRVFSKVKVLWIK